MGSYTFDIARAIELINSRVGTGIDTTVDEILDLAIQLAPVRKKGRRKKRTTAVGGVRTKHDFPIGRRRTVSVTGGQMYAAYARLAPYSHKRKDGSVSHSETMTRAQFRKAKMFDRERNPRVVTPEEYDARASAASSGKPRGVLRGAEKINPKGHLRDRITRTDVVIENGTISASVRSEAEYSRFVEFPTRRTAAQPFLLPAFKAARSRLKANIKAAKGG